MFRRLPLSLPIAGAVLAAMVMSVPAAQAGGYPAASYKVSLKTTVHLAVPVDATKNGWCYDAGIVDPNTHVFYLADAANKRITVISPRTKKVSAIGPGLFTGIANCHQNNFDGMGPNGLVIAGDDIYAGNGNSHVLGFDRRARMVARPPVHLGARHHAVTERR